MGQAATPIFDVRPKESENSLGLARLKKIRQTLSDRRAILRARYESGRVIDLRETESSAPVFESPKVLKRRKKRLSENPTPDSAPIPERARPLVAEGLEISHPTREEIMAILDEIERLNLHLKEFGLREPVSQSLPQEPEEILPDAVFAQELSLEEYLGLNPGIQTVEHFLDERSSFPEDPVVFVEDLESFLGIGKEIVIVETAEPAPRIEAPAGKKEFFFNRRFLRGTGFAVAGLLIFFGVLAMSIAGQGLLAKENILSSALEAYRAMLAAKDSVLDKDFSAAQVSFESAYQDFLRAEGELDRLGGVLISFLEKIPGDSIVSSGSALVQAGEDLARAGTDFAKIGEVFSFQKISESFAPGRDSLTQKIVKAKHDIADATAAINSANRNLGKVEVAVLPANIAPAVQDLKQKLPPIAAALNELNSWSDTFLEVLGHKKTKKYLLLFQNNSEARATGGFIGTYGTVELDEGRIENLFISNIYDLDGQFFEKICPPLPLERISDNWRIHDVNWFADWPTSARKVALYYEKAGGTTVDGVISLTPEVFERLLEATGPIELPEYQVFLDSVNFRDVVQYKVEADYDRKLNQPKKILADFADKFMDRLWVVWPDKSQEILSALTDSLSQKNILFYFSEPGVQKRFLEQGWAGEVMATEKDYLMVVNTNVKGFKTDRVIEQKIFHQAEIQTDGSVIDTVQITRIHQGGTSQYQWYNESNVDYLRLYVPAGSKLLSAQGFFGKPEEYLAPSCSVEDSDLSVQKAGTQNVQGTQVFGESGKTVFGNWVIVRPGESRTVAFKYLLPFKIDPRQSSASYTLLAQKQSGAKAGALESVLVLPSDFKVSWKYPENLELVGKQIRFSENLNTDKFFGIVFGN